MWIYDTKTLQFLAINDAAIYAYGYSEDEFLKMTVLDIRPKHDVARFLALSQQPHESTAETWFHVGKDGIPFSVSITSWELIFQGRRAELVLARRDDRPKKDVQQDI
jgi:PAS domain S-box-containing protein